jgi:hypothetical protein
MLTSVHARDPLPPPTLADNCGIAAGARVSWHHRRLGMRAQSRTDRSCKWRIAAALTRVIDGETFFYTHDEKRTLIDAVDRVRPTQTHDRRWCANRR